MVGVAIVGGLVAFFVFLSVQLTKEQRAVLRARRQKGRHSKHH